jgi:hypothetical protein
MDSTTLIGVDPAQEGDMVFRKDKKGGGWHEPPYTWEENCLREV